MIENLNNFLRKYNYRAGIISFSRLEELRRELEDLYEKEYIDKTLYESHLSSFTFNKAESSFKPESVIIVAVPRPQHRIYFNIKNKHLPVLIPPTYVNSNKINQEAAALLNRYMSGTGYMVDDAILPEKLLAVRSGISKYGKNNISYIEDLGSFYQLASFFSNVSCSDESWYEERELEKCSDCRACLKNCPTGAITARRFLLHAEKCLTFLNEGDGDFPAWIKPEFHSCLIGCIRCQIVCPYNRPFTSWIEDIGEFSAEETEYLLEELPPDRLPSSIVKKINLMGLDGYIGKIPRNLKALVRKEKI
ncbi:MAG TPA: 4Fe-4S double cluster binding domain-containing protein [Candidatus Hydromicrobium sp.]